MPLSDTPFAERLRRLRQTAGLSQEELAERADLTAAAIGALERGERRRPYPQTLRALADALELDDAERAAFFNLVPRRGKKGDVSPRPAEEEAPEPAPEEPREEAPPAPATPRRRWVVALPWALAWVLAGALVGWLAGRGPRPAPSTVPRQMVWTLPPPEGTAYVTTSGPPALSPDGRHLAYVARPAEGPRRLWLRSLAVAAPQPLPGSDGASFPFWSPDGRWIAFFAGGRLRKLDPATGEAHELAAVEEAQGGTWSTDGTILAARDGGRSVVRISPGGELDEVLPRRPSGTEWYFTPCFLPDGKRYFVSVLSVASDRPAGLYLVELATGEASWLMPVFSNVRYTPPGQLVYYHEGALRAQRFHLGTPATGDEAILLADAVAYSSFDLAALFAVDERLLVHLPGGVVAGSELVFVDRRGTLLGVLGEAGDYFHPRLSPDGSRLAVDVSGALLTMGDIWILDALRGAATRLTSDPRNESRPVFSPDGRQVVYVKGKSIYSRPTSGAGEETLLLADDETAQPVDFSPDGRRLLFSKGFDDLWLLDLTNGEAAPWLISPFRLGNARFSPDGHWIAYTSDETGRYEVYVEDFPERREKHAVSLGEGWGPVWSRDGTELFFYLPGRGLMTIGIRLGRELTAEKPRLLFPVELRNLDGAAFYDVFPDGDRFLVNRLVEGTTDEPLVLRSGWTASLGPA